MTSLASGLYFWSRVYYVSFVGICLLVSSFSDFRIFGIVQRHQFQIRVQQLALPTPNTANILYIGGLKTLKKSATNTFIFYHFIFLFYLPKLISLCLCTISNKTWTNMGNLADYVVFMNSSINSILYCWRLESFERQFF